MTTLLLHGLGADRRQPLELLGPPVRETAGPAEPILAFDVRAHGDSALIGTPADFALDRLADEAVATARAADPAIGDHPLTIMGISMGAAIALRIALRGLLPVDRAVFVRPSFGDEPHPENLRPFPVIGQLLHDRGAGASDDFRESGVYLRMQHRSPAGARALLAQFAAPRAAERAVRLVEVPRNRAFADDAELGLLPARGIRSLVVATERDPVHPLELGERWAAGLDAEFATAPAREQGMAGVTAAVRDGVARWLARTPER
ncbi:alpha/beta fold hydrolase [Agromyces soli]